MLEDHRQLLNRAQHLQIVHIHTLHTAQEHDWKLFLTIMLSVGCGLWYQDTLAVHHIMDTAQQLSFQIDNDVPGTLSAPLGKVIETCGPVVRDSA